MGGISRLTWHGRVPEVNLSLSGSQRVFTRYSAWMCEFEIASFITSHTNWKSMVFAVQPWIYYQQNVVQKFETYFLGFLLFFQPCIVWIEIILEEFQVFLLGNKVSIVEKVILSILISLFSHFNFQKQGFLQGLCIRNNTIFGAIWFVDQKNRYLSNQNGRFLFQ